MSSLRVAVRAPRSLSALVWIGCAGLAACGTGEHVSGDTPPQAVERKFAPTEWETVFEIASSAEDSTLLMPVRPAAVEDGVYLADFHGNRILHFGEEGELRWSFGRKGAGPDEFRRIRDLKVDSAGRAWILDQDNQRVTVLDRAGAVQMRIPLGSVDHLPQGIIPQPGEEVVVIVTDTKAPFVRLDSQGRVVERTAFPWPGYEEMHYMAGQLTSAVDPRSGRWFAAFQTGNGFFPFRGNEWLGYRGWYVEHVDFPEIEQKQSGNTTVTAPKTKPVTATTSITVSPERLYVLFRGASGFGKRVVDSYSLADGAYIESVLLPNKVDDIAWSDGGLYVLYNDPYPHLALWRPRQVRLP